MPIRKGLTAIVHPTFNPIGYRIEFSDGGIEHFYIKTIPLLGFSIVYYERTTSKTEDKVIMDYGFNFDIEYTLQDIIITHLDVVKDHYEIQSSPI